MRADCYFCHNEVDTADRYTVRQEIGWSEINRRAGGAHNLIARNPVQDMTGRLVYAHKTCAQIGVRGQGELFHES